MQNRKLLFVLSISTLALAACAPQVKQVASTPLPEGTWAFEQSDVPVDPGYRFGRLPNGMRYVIRQNATPKGTALVRLQIDAGALDESDAERGFAHYVEHMAFNGSTNVPEGEMVKLLERHGLAFGADTNASTGYDRTTYKLDLPRNDPELLDIALMLMRETASELSFNPGAVDRERGVVQSEMRDRNSYALKAYQDQIEFLLPGSHLSRRLPIGTAESLANASAEGLKGFWQREYVPQHATVYVIGDFDAALVEQKIKDRFGSWKPAKVDPMPKVGPVTLEAKGQADVYIDPALSERVSASRKGAYLVEPDSLAQRKENLLRQVGYAIINRRLLRRTRETDAPFRNASFGTSDVFKEGRATELSIDTVDGKWRRGMIEAALEYRRAMTFGFTPEEVAEQVAIIRTAHANAAKGEATRSNAQLLGAAEALVINEKVPDTPTNSLDRLEAYLPEVTPEAVQAALKRETVPLDDPLLRFQGRTPPAGGGKGLQQAWAEAMAAPIRPAERKVAGSFGYTDFGPAGRVVSDTVEPLLGIRTIRFANGVRLNLKRTELKQDQVLIQISVDGGSMLATRENPLATQMISVLAVGGLGKHSKDELDSLLAGRTVSANFAATDETFVATSATTPRDLELQLQLMTAQVTDPGYRKEGETLFLQSINNLFASLRATPGSALSADVGGIVSDNDPRFSLGKVEDYRKLTFAGLKQDTADRFRNGAIEIGIVGDIDEAATVAMVARTFGALPQRESDFRPYDDRRDRPFTKDRSRKVLRHTGAKDQGLVTFIWPTRDGEDLNAALQLQLLERVMRIEITDTLREKLGKAYSPGASSNASRTWKNYGTFSINASVDVKEVPATRAAMLETVGTMRDAPVTDDVLTRAREPLLEGLDNLLKSNAGWLSFVDRAQTEPEQMERYAKSKDLLKAITPAELQALAKTYLSAESALEVDVLPEGVDDPVTSAPKN
ncbi:MULTISPECIES: M16 family metallopeptidase [unclassified Novosphingobium]|uniref:M16 family metallopeptidase n=1 Tax=unclassified Novosphingobium TaxID=2644732 RepID=UPI000ED3288D|nr:MULTISPECIES: M16 family metallopeptidase [unclassified Novosphingobium]HCF25347.1 peptidase M16 [Novosphingobium sp.]HQV03609.1 insulinase family protein [Novosphingobium sp.]